MYHLTSTGRWGQQTAQNGGQRTTAEVVDGENSWAQSELRQHFRSAGTVAEPEQGLQQVARPDTSSEMQAAPWATKSNNLLPIFCRVEDHVSVIVIFAGMGVGANATLYFFDFF
ncbi:hypothetical protein [Rhodoblastus sp.]|jgi:hypothetical protein|uniref:hypothetical protein n=1 Tax=Rhodoblastus sp. TaxID=1962975 RepID=UPI0025EA082A|nr:hypothetical protein [Rhodoblastus sp.]